MPDPSQEQIVAELEKIAGSETIQQHILIKEWFSMSMVRKLHPHIAKDLREFLSENNISTR